VHAQDTSNRNHIQEVYKRYLLRTFDRMLYGISICYWFHIMLLISHRHVTGNAARILYSVDILKYSINNVLYIVCMIIWYQKIIENSSKVLIVKKIKR
jgi:hypothetical protein